MLTFNPRTGDILKDSEVISDNKILYYIDYGLELESGSEKNFSLLSIKRMLKKYPSLKKLTEWSESFMEQAEKVASRIGIIKDCDHEWEDHEIQYLVLEKCFSTEYCDLTACADFDAPDGIGMTYTDVPSLRQRISESLSGFSIAGNQSLSLTPLKDVFYMPIKILNDKKKLFQHFATEDRAGIDYKKSKRLKLESSKSSISIGGMLTAIMMDLCLDDEEDRADRFHMIKELADELEDMDEKI